MASTDDLIPTAAVGLVALFEDNTDRAIGYVQALFDWQQETYTAVASLLLDRFAAGLDELNIDVPGIAVTMPEGTELPDPLPPMLAGATEAVRAVAAVRAGRQPSEDAPEPLTDRHDQTEFVNGWWFQLLALASYLDRAQLEARAADIAAQN
jgi:hypothetical protein